jgi:hypothetical protein
VEEGKRAAALRGVLKKAMLEKVGYRRVLITEEGRLQLIQTILQTRHELHGVRSEF